MDNPIIQVFELCRSWAEEHVTIFATDLRHAESIYFEWVKAHHPDRPTEAHMAFPCYGRWLLGRPELGAACRLGVTGVGYWHRSSSRWVIASPLDPPTGDLARTSRGVKYYRASATDGDELMVFAESMDEAAGYYLTWHIEAYGSAPDGMQIHQRSKWQLVLALAPLRDEMDAGEVGTAHWSADEGWHIVDPEDGTVLSGHLP
jgi:hypothetical protein